jgi:hypothetical protein
LISCYISQGQFLCIRVEVGHGGENDGSDHVVLCCGKYDS